VIRPFVPAESEILERFRAQLSDRRLTLAERERIETQIRNEMEQASRRGAELTFTYQGRFAIPTEVGRAIITAVPLNWSQLAIGTKGVLRLPGFYGTEEAIPLDQVKAAPLPLAIVMSTQASRRLYGRFRELRRSTPGILSVSDPKTGRSFRDIERDARDLEVFQLNRLRAALETYQFDGADQVTPLVARRVADLDMEIAESRGNVEAIGQTLKEFVETIVGMKGRPIERRSAGAEGTPAPGPTTIPQLSESFIDRVIDIASRSQPEQTYIQEQTKRQMEFSERAVLLKAEQDEWKELLSRLNTRASGGNPGAPLTPQLREELAQSLERVVNGLNAVWGAVTRAQADFTAKRLGFSSQLYAPYAVQRDVVWFHPLMQTTVWATFLLLALLLILAAWGAHALFRLYSENR
jgi:hypothetical protein